MLKGEALKSTEFPQCISSSWHRKTEPYPYSLGTTLMWFVQQLKLYSQERVQEYWIADTDLRQVQVYRQEDAVLTLVVTLQGSDRMSSPLLPGFICPLNRVFAPPRQ